jgi:hypothetical protein
MVTRTVETVTAVGKGVGKDVKDTAEQYAGRAARLGVEAADAVVTTGRGAAAQVSEAAEHVAGAAADAVVTGRDVAAQTAGQLARHLPGSGPPDASEVAASAPGTELLPPPIPGFADLPAHAAVAALRTLDDPRAVSAMLEFEQAHGNRPGVVAAARLRATTVGTG